AGRTRNCAPEPHCCRCGTELSDPRGRRCAMFASAPIERCPRPTVTGSHREEHMKFRPAMPGDDRRYAVAAATDMPTDLMSAAAQGSDPKLDGNGDSQAGWSSVSVSKWNRVKRVDRRSEKIRSWRR